MNAASRVQELCKKLDEKILLAHSVSKRMTRSMQLVGYHSIRSLLEESFVRDFGINAGLS